MSRITFSCVSERRGERCFVSELPRRDGKKKRCGAVGNKSAKPPLIRYDLYKQKNKAVQNRKIGVTVVAGFFDFPPFFCPFPVILSAPLSLPLFPFPLFSPYAVGGREDEGDEQQHPHGDKDAGHQELGGIVS